MFNIDIFKDILVKNNKKSTNLRKYEEKKQNYADINPTFLPDIAGYEHRMQDRESALES